MSEADVPKSLVKHQRRIQDDYSLFGFFGSSEPKTGPMHYTDPLLCFIIKAVALGLQTPCPLSVCCVAEVVLILDPISPPACSI